MLYVYMAAFFKFKLSICGFMNIMDSMHIYMQHIYIIYDISAFPHFFSPWTSIYVLCGQIYRNTIINNIEVQYRLAKLYVASTLELLVMML